MNVRRARAASVMRLVCVLLAAAWVVHLHGSARRPAVVALQDVRHVEGHRYLARLPAGLPPGDHHDASGAEVRCSQARLLEDGEELGAPHALHRDIAHLGGGLHSHWRDGLTFSTSDNTDPRVNGRTYTLAFPGPAGHPWRLAAWGLLMAAAAWWASSGRAVRRADGSTSGASLALRIALGAGALTAAAGVIHAVDVTDADTVADANANAHAGADADADVQPASAFAPDAIAPVPPTSPHAPDAMANPGLPVVAAGQPVPCGDWAPCDGDVAPSAAHLPTRPLLDPAPAERRGRTWVFPQPGVYRLTDGASLRSVLAVGTSPVENALVAFSFATGAASGASSENAAFGADRPGFTRDLFRRSEPADLACGPTAQVMGRVLDVVGIEHRLVQWVGESERYLAHQSLEVHLPEQGWTLYDPHLGLAFAPGWSALEVFEQARSGQPLAPHVASFVPKATWEDAPLETYARYDTALGHFDGGRIALLVGDPEILASFATESWSVHAVDAVERAEVAARFYAGDDVGVAAR